ncbi:hypothetical protein KQX54_000370, partial [Cotesia glomerata]
VFRLRLLFGADEMIKFVRISVTLCDNYFKAMHQEQFILTLMCYLTCGALFKEANLLGLMKVVAV